MFAATRIALRCSRPRLLPLPPTPLLGFVDGRRGLLATAAAATSTAAAAQEPAPPSTTTADDAAATAAPNPPDAPPFVPPPFCPGCGAPSQQTSPALPGYYHPRRPKSERFASPKIKTQRKHREDEIYRAALDRLAASLDPTNATLHQAPPILDAPPPRLPPPPPPPPPRIPRCARCHAMQHQNTAPPLPSYPTLETLAGLLAASRHRKNHIYHLLDAADLPMSLQPDLRSYLWRTLPRAVTRELTISYVVTRADLLLRTWQQVSSLMTWMKKTVKDALPEGERVEGRHGSGDDEKFWAVSAKRGWGVGDIKRDAKHREGGIWLVGAVNVGKSRLVKEVWPEAGRAVMGSMEEAGEFDILPPPAQGADNDPDAPPPPPQKKKTKKEKKNLAPAPPAESSHIAPTVSHIPGTTAAPIRIVYKTAGRSTTSELIDLPGLSRWVGSHEPTGLLPYIRTDKHKLFHMESYTKPHQISIKRGQSLVIAGVIMLTPRIEGDDELVVLAYPFLGLPVHLTATQKAIRILGERDPEGRKGLKLYQKPPVAVGDGESVVDEKPVAGGESVVDEKPVADEVMVEGTTRTSDTVDGMATDPAAEEEEEAVTDTQAAATHSLEQDPSKDTTPTATSTSDLNDDDDDANLPPAVLPPHIKSAGLYTLTNDVTAARDLHLHSRSPESLDALPYRILATDILLSGIGWIELVAQVRKRREESGALQVAVEVFTPGGGGVGQRDTMGAWMLREKAARRAGAGPPKVVRQRMSKSGEKKRRKAEKKAAGGGA